MSLFRCPVCGAPLNREEHTYRCAAGHSYDIAKEGYTYLLPPNQKHSADPGDDKAMSAARRDFLSKEYYMPLLNTLCSRILPLVGAGRSELVEGIFGMHPLSSGEIYVKGKKVNVSSPQDIIKEGVALITEDRKVTGLNLSGTVNDNIAMVAIKKLLTNGLYNKSKAYKASQEYIEKLNIKTPSANQIVGNLSGGNQQKVVIAKWLLNEPDIIILDEPTRGIDVGAKRDIYLLLGKLVQQGKAVIMISSEIPELMGICDRVLVMCEGNDSGEVKREDFSQERIMTLASAITV